MGSGYLDKVKAESCNRLDRLKDALGSASDLAGNDGTIFATGSYGRLEAGPESDLDVFIVSRAKGNPPAPPYKPSMDQVRQIRLKSELIIAAEKAGMAEFDAGGKFLETHVYDEIVKEVGSPADDYKNTFTGRMLLILESRPLLGNELYERLKKDAIQSYFRDFAGHAGEFVPYFLVNDLLRMWRTFCVNYEFFREGTSDWRVKNLKLKYTRMLTCYSALLYISAVYRMKESVTPNDISEMSAITPVERVRLFSGDGSFAAHGEIQKLVDLSERIVSEYEIFLEFVQEKKAAIKALKTDEDSWRERSHSFGALIASSLQLVSGDDPFANKLFRSILV